MKSAAAALSARMLRRGRRPPRSAMSATARSKPAAASASAMARPMPRAPPVTSATGRSGMGHLGGTAASPCAMWSATRRACAAMVRAGLTAAEVGRKPASTTNRFGWSCARQNGSSAEVAGSVPKRTVPHWCEACAGRRPRQHDRVAGGAEQLAHARRPAPVCAAMLRAPPVERDRSPSTRTRLSGSGRSSLIRYQSTLCAASQARAGSGHAAQIGLEDRRRDLPEQLDIAERRAAARRRRSRNR